MGLCSIVRLPFAFPLWSLSLFSLEGFFFFSFRWQSNWQIYCFHESFLMKISFFVCLFPGPAICVFQHIVSPCSRNWISGCNIREYFLIRTYLDVGYCLTDLPFSVIHFPLVICQGSKFHPFLGLVSAGHKQPLLFQFNSCPCIAQYCLDVIIAYT